MTLALRDYQQELVAGSVDLWRRGHRRIAMVLPTGGGKTPTAMHLAEMSLGAGRPVLWLAHRTELIDQAIDKAEQVAPGRRIGRLQARTKEYMADLVVGSVQTASTPGSLNLLRSRRWGFIVIDETHHVAAVTYQRVLRELRAFEPDGPLVLGVTATLDRSDGLSLGATFEAVAEPRIGLLDLIKRGYLVPPRGIRVRIEGLDLRVVRRVAGDFSGAALGAAMSAAMAPQRIVEAWAEHAKGRPTVAFLPTVAISIEQAEAFRQAGYTAAHLDADTGADARADALASFRRGEIDVLCNVGLFTEGTDLPSIGCVILGRPTSSSGLYMQMLGRGLRLHPGKRNCIILDVCGVTGRHKVATLASLAGADSPEDIPDDLLMYEEDLTGDEDAPEAEDKGADAPEYADGSLEHELIDLFGQSHSAWLRTAGGIWFLPAGSHGFVYLADRGDDRYALCWHNGDQGDVIQDSMEIGYAMAAGDEYVAARPMWQAERDAPWRLQPARGAGGRTRGELHDEKMTARASRILDGPNR